MLEKKLKGVLISNLRTICLMEADFDFDNKILVRDLIKCAERYRNIPKEQYGRRKGKNPLCTLSTND